MSRLLQGLDNLQHRLLGRHYQRWFCEWVWEGLDGPDD